MKWKWKKKHCNKDASFLLQNHIEECLKEMNDMLPSYLKPKSVENNQESSPDSTLDMGAPGPVQSQEQIQEQVPQQTVPSFEDNYLHITVPRNDLPPSSELEASPRSVTNSEASLATFSSSPEPDLFCPEFLANESALAEEVGEVDPSRSPATLCDVDSRTSSPISAADIFTDFNTNVLKAAYAEAEKKSADSSSNNKDSPFSILVSWPADGQPCIKIPRLFQSSQIHTDFRKKKKDKSISMKVQKVKNSGHQGGCKLLKKAAPSNQLLRLFIPCSVYDNVW